MLVLVACDDGDGRDLRPPTSEQRAAMTTTTSSTTSVPGLPSEATGVPTLAPPATAVTPFALQLPSAPGGAIDVRFTCDGEGRSPLLIWSAPPAGTVELALLVTDDDAAGFVHWAVAGIAPTAGEVGEGGQITGALEGVNDFGDPGWGGPCPPAGAPHTYRFALYAFAQQAELPDGFTGGDLLAIAASSNIALAESTATYTRSS